MPTSEHLSILLLEDSTHDAELVEHELRRASVDALVHRVQSEEAFRAALDGSPPQIILADFHLPDFDGISALRIARQQVPDIPFILVSGGMGEELAVEALREGATDYIIKDRLSRLVPAIARALEEVRQKRAQQLLRQSEHRFRTLAETAHDAIILSNQEGAVLFWNAGAERIFGFSAAEMLNEPVTKILVDEDARAWDSRSRAYGEPCDPALMAGVLSMTGRRKNGTETRLECSLTPWRSDDQLLFTAIVRERPLHGQREQGRPGHRSDAAPIAGVDAEMERMSRVRVLGRVAATIVHEFNNVLMGIQPFADVMKRVSTDEAVKRHADRILESVARGKRANQQILGLTQPPVPAMKPVSVTDWLGHVFAELRETAGERVDLHFDLPAEPLWIRGDRVQLQQMLAKLAVNAAEAMPDGGRLTISACAPNEGTVRLQITDTGTGMSADILPNIFEPLFTTRRSHMGLGLAAVEQIISAHGGTIHAQSQPGTGTTFTIDLPASPATDDSLGDGEKR